MMKKTNTHIGKSINSYGKSIEILGHIQEIIVRYIKEIIIVRFGTKLELSSAKESKIHLLVL